MTSRERRNQINTPGPMSIPTRSTPRREGTIHAHTAYVPIPRCRHRRNCISFRYSIILFSSSKSPRCSAMSTVRGTHIIPWCICVAVSWCCTRGGSSGFRACEEDVIPHPGTRSRDTRRTFRRRIICFSRAAFPRCRLRQRGREFAEAG